MTRFRSYELRCLLPSGRDPNVGGSNPDNDPHTTLQEWIADTNPTNALSYFRISSIPSPALISFASSSNRFYTVYSSTNLNISNSFTAVPGQANVPGNGGILTLNGNSNAPAKFYRVGVTVP